MSQICVKIPLRHSVLCILSAVRESWVDSGCSSSPAKTNFSKLATTNAHFIGSFSGSRTLLSSL
uniref:Uncharacterized protein n=1 Tax=Lutzomyia longipalpis TaxID=7200 RepID=A0A1B0GIR6_LUTLO